MKITKLYILLLAGIVIFLSTTAYFLNDKQVAEEKDSEYSKTVLTPVSSYDNSKVIKFNHKIHVKDIGIKCQDCHANAPKSVSAKDNLNPTQEYCGTCHDVKDQKTCNYCHFDNKYKKLKVSKTELIFSHKQHIETQNKQCLDCHSGLDTVKYSKESAAAFPNMESCYSCHNTQKASNNCESCHSNLTNLKPQNHRKPNFLNEHKSESDLVSAKNNCMMCHSDNFCQACHSTNTFNGNNTKNNFFAPYYTKETGVRTDRTALQKLNTFHDMSYRMTHGLDAGSKSFECKTCHEPVTFCASCHQDNGEVITGFLPKSHLQPNFTTIGVNTGGGLHSDLARKDIESCQSCHDASGSDPTCLKCHFDNNGIKGTHPKTHESGFLHDENGNWHQTQGAVCYTCHTDANARPNGISGIGFCGYCHGAKK